MSYLVFKASDALTAIKNDPEGVWIIEKKKKDPTKQYKCSYVDVWFTIGNFKHKQGWFSFKNFVLSIGVADKNDLKDPRNKYAGTRSQLQSSLSKSGDLGQFIMKSNPQWARLFELRKADGTISVGPKRSFHPLLQTHISEECENTEMRGKELDDPIVRLKIDWIPFPESFPGFLAKQPRTRFYDYRKSYVDDEGETQYELAKVKVNGEEVFVNDDNLHLFATKGSIIHDGTVLIQSVVSSQSWVSIPITVCKVVMEPGPDEGFVEAEVVFDNTSKPNQQPQSVQSSVSDQSSQNTSVVASTVAASESEIDQALNGLI